MKIRLLTLTVCAGLLLTLPAASIAGIEYAITDLGLEVLPSDINSSGQVTGSDANTSHAFIYSHGAFTNLGSIGGNSSYGVGIRDDGQVVGRSAGFAFLYSGGSMAPVDSHHPLFEARAINDSGTIVGYGLGGPPSNAFYHAWLYSGGEETDFLGEDAGNRSEADDINEHGVIVGTLSNGDQNYRAFAYSSGQVSTLATLGGTSSAAKINRYDKIVGFSKLANGDTHAVEWDEGVPLDLGTLGGQNSFGTAINDAGQIVGYANPPTGSGNHAFIYRNGVMVDLNTLIDPSVSVGWILDNVTGINNVGQIIGSFMAGTHEHGFLLTPIPSGDFTTDGAVDAADYVYWRKNYNGDQERFNQWRTNFGAGSQGARIAALNTQAVPEPGVCLLTILGLLAAAQMRSSSES